MHDHDVAAAFTDTYAYEVFPPPSPDWSDTLAVHMLHIRDMGLIQGQNWDLEALAADCAADGQHDMLLRRRARADHRRHQHPGQPGGGEVGATWGTSAGTRGAPRGGSGAKRW